MTQKTGCDICGELTSFERNSIDQPHEGEVCSICGQWVCINHVDWSKSGYEYDTICTECSSKVMT